MTEGTVRVAAVWGGWSVQCDELDHPLMFLSGAKAEAKAHELGRRMAQRGRTARVTIHDRHQAPLVTALYFANDLVEATPAAPATLKLTHPAPLPPTGLSAATGCA